MVGRVGGACVSAIIRECHHEAVRMPQPYSESLAWFLVTSSVQSLLSTCKKEEIQSVKIKDRREGGTCIAAMFRGRYLGFPHLLLLVPALEAA